MAMVNGHGWACDEVAGGGGWVAVAVGGSGGSVRIGADLTKFDFLVRNVLLNIFVTISGPSRPQRWIQLEISITKMLE